jgi:hypothetical protein
MEQHDGRRARRRAPRYSNVLPGIALLAALAVLMLGVAAVRLGFVAVDVRLGARLSGGAATTSVALATPITEKAAGPKRARPWRRARVVDDAAAAAARVETLATEAALLDEALGSPVSTAAAAAVPSKALAVSAGAVKRVAECAGVVTPAGNQDPTNGEIAGMTGLPDQLNYFKARGRKPACHPLASSQ